jgi:hypothetical protein
MTERGAVGGSGWLMSLPYRRPRGSVVILVCLEVRVAVLRGPQER